MRFQFDPAGERAGGIRLIDEIPDYRICHLEGRNGAGKSLALRLLELVSGEQPYQTTPGAWSSLRENLGETTVTITGLNGRTLRVKLKPEQWTKESLEPVGDWLGEAVLDGEPIAISAIASHLRVVRIGGDETFEVTIQRRLAAESASIQRAHGRFVDQFSQLVSLLDELGKEVSIGELERRDKEQLDIIESKIADANHHLRSQQEEFSVLEKALLARKRLPALVDKLPAIEKQLSQLESKRRALDEELRSAQKKETALLVGLAGGSEVEEQVEKVRANRDKLLKSLQGVTKEVQSVAARIDVAADLKAVAVATADAEREQRVVQAELSSAGHNASIRNLTSQIARDLDAHPELEREIVAVLEADTAKLRLAARELKVGVQRRQLELVEIEDDPLLRELNLRNNNISQRIAELTELRNLIRKHERSLKLLKKSEADLEALVGRAKTTSELRAEYDAVAADVIRIRSDLDQHLSEEARLRVQADQLRGGKSAEELAEQVTLALQRLELKDESALDQRFDVVKTSLDEQRVRLRQLWAEQVELQSSLSRQRAEMERIAGRLATVAWLPISVRQMLARAHESQRGQVLIALRSAVESASNSLYTARDWFDKLRHAADELPKIVGRRDRNPSEVAFLEEYTEEMGERLRREFDQEEIRIALFDESKLEAIDLRNLEAQWTTKGGERRTRPFEAFSSGEQMFAYTRARIQRVASVDAQHKVIALDEFGAFLARDRLERLARYLRDAVVGSIADQVIIVVPLAANYKAQAESTTGELHERFVRRAAEIERHRYFTEDATEREFI